MGSQIPDSARIAVALRGIVGRDPAFLAVVRKVPRVAGSEAPALLLGETGTGKELVA
ncbi:MAG: sigma 54-interacting transcriptional regulator, partial [Thermoanaerobaculia bacterium]|nr:sigma 54-interacting transcriptional regulator [Thermoanaerobaculia bacterium]